MTRKELLILSMFEKEAGAAEDIAETYGMPVGKELQEAVRETPWYLKRLAGRWKKGALIGIPSAAVLAAATTYGLSKRKHPKRK